jgi:hypothetical protein
MRNHGTDPRTGMRVLTCSSSGDMVRERLAR